MQLFYHLFSFVYVVVNFLSQVIFVFLLFWGMVMYANEVETKEKKITQDKKLTTTCIPYHYQWIILSLNAVAVYFFDNWGGFQQVSSLFQNFTLTCHLSFIIGVGSGSPWTNTWWKNQLESLLVCLKFHPVSMRNYKPNAKCFLSPV